MLRKLAILVLLAPFVFCSATNYFFHNVNVKDGLIDNFVRDVVRDSYGYIWFSTINGISSYDGYSFYNYSPHQFGAITDDVLFIRETADSTLWMICGGELFTFSRVNNQWNKNGVSLLAKLGVKGTLKVFYVDDRQNMWLTTDHGLYHYDYAQRMLFNIENYSKSPISHIVSKNGNTVVVTSDYKIFEVALKERRLIPIAQAPEVSYHRDSRVFLDNAMNLWVYHSHSQGGSQWLLSLKTRKWRQSDELKQMGNAIVNAITEDNDGNLWVGTGNAGIYVFSYQDGKWSMMMNINAFRPRSSHISCLYLDSNNTMWIGSAKLGAAFTDMNCPDFNVISTGEYEDVSSLLEDPKGNLWIGFDGGGVMMKSKSGSIQHYSALRQQLPSNIVTSLAIDGQTLLVGTYGGGIARFDGTKFNPVYSDYPFLKYVKAMTTDAHGDLWVATVDKGIVKIDSDGKVTNYTSDNSLLLSNGTLCLAYDSLHDIIYIGTSNGIAAYDCAKGRFIENKQIGQFKGEYVNSLMICNRNRLWIGSRKGLWVYHSTEGSVRHFTTAQGMSHNAVRALAKSGDCVWASTDNGLTCISSMTDSSQQARYICYPFFDSDGLHNLVFSNNAAITTSDGMALLGNFSGYVSIQPDNFVTHYPKLHVQYTNCRINGIIVSKSSSVFTIKHDDRLRVSVSAMTPALSHKIMYHYRFKGEKEWMTTPNGILDFVSLHPGMHVLQVKAELPGLIESDIVELTIKVLPSIWLSKTALLLYFLLIAAIVYFLYKSMQKRQKRKLAMKQMELNLRKYEMEEEKIRFFTNIGHDIKTPLTLVVAPLDKIRSTNLPAPIRTELDVAWRNARQLYDLVLQLLDFQRLDAGKEKLNLKHGDIVNFVRETVQGFSYYATHKNIKIQLSLPPTSMEIDFDENKMRRIITNLLSNAFKYNVDNGTVTVSLGVNEVEGVRKMVISVADTGIGVNDKKHIFDRFVQETHGQEQEGSGLGLHIVRHYVGMMGGSIDIADNKPRGTVFTITLPVAESVLPIIEDIPATSLSVPEEIIESDTTEYKPTILVVDDNMDTRLFLQRSLDEYHVLLAANGKEALDVLAHNENVGIVISDVMMPEMDGIELFRHIKSDINYSHIPMVLLTAKSSEESIVAGLEEGAADYITKPFNLAVLRLRIRKILEWSQHAHASIATGLEIKPSEITVSSLDEELISHVISNIEANIQDMNYSVVQLSSSVGMTRGHLYKKLMAITGKSPLEFIRIIKLKRGKSLLDQGKTNISEVADMVGFSAKQFSHYFKLMYGDTPSEYLKKRKRHP